MGDTQLENELKVTFQICKTEKKSEKGKIIN